MWGADGWDKQRNKFLQTPSGHTSSTSSDTRVQFHQDQIHFLAVHETQIALYDANNLECVKQVFSLQASFSAGELSFLRVNLFSSSVNFYSLYLVGPT